MGVRFLLKRQFFCSNKEIRWKFNLEQAPWMGGEGMGGEGEGKGWDWMRGIYERLVSPVKRCLKKTIGVKRLTYVELQTLVLEAEIILNNRPLCEPLDDDPELALTPNHFGRRLEPTSQVHCSDDVREENTNSCNRRQQHTVRRLSDGRLGGNRKCPSYRGVRLIEVFQFWASTWKKGKRALYIMLWSPRG